MSDLTGDAGAPPPVASQQVRWPVSLQRWEDVGFLHWPVDAALLAHLVPEDLTPLTWDGTAWVGVTPFRIRVRPPPLPMIPATWWAFPETNVRTYVAAPDGTEGIWFLRLEVPELWFVAALRTLGLPYVQQRMTARTRDRVQHYTSTPLGTGSRPSHEIVVRMGEVLRPPEGGPFERFLTARWNSFHGIGPLRLRTPVEHPPWPLHHGVAEVWDVAELFEAVGLPAPTTEPVVHASPGVTVRLGAPRRV